MSILNLGSLLGGVKSADNAINPQQIAALFAAQAEPHRALPLARLVLAHRASNHATRQHASQMNDRLTPQLPRAELAALQARLQSTAFDALVTELLYR